MKASVKGGSKDVPRYHCYSLSVPVTFMAIFSFLSMFATLIREIIWARRNFAKDQQ
jgi:hypothetical protein